MRDIIIQDIAHDLNVEGKSFEEIINYLSSLSDGKEKINAYINKYEDDILDIKDELEQLKTEYNDEMEGIISQEEEVRRSKEANTLKFKNYERIVNDLENGKINETNQIELKDIENKIDVINKNSILLNGNLSNRSLKEKEKLEKRKEELSRTVDDYINLREETRALYQKDFQLIEEYQTMKKDIIVNYQNRKNELDIKLSNLLNCKLMYVEILSKINNSNINEIDKSYIEDENKPEESVENLFNILDEQKADSIEESNLNQDNIISEVEEDKLDEIPNPFVYEEPKKEEIDQQKPVEISQNSNLYVFEPDKIEIDNDSLSLENIKQEVQVPTAPINNEPEIQLEETLENKTVETDSDFTELVNDLYDTEEGVGSITNEPEVQLEENKAVESNVEVNDEIIETEAIEQPEEIKEEKPKKHLLFGKRKEKKNKKKTETEEQPEEIIEPIIEEKIDEEPSENIEPIVEENIENQPEEVQNINDEQGIMEPEEMHEIFNLQPKQIQPLGQPNTIVNVEDTKQELYPELGNLYNETKYDNSIDDGQKTI